MCHTWDGCCPPIRNRMQGERWVSHLQVKGKQYSQTWFEDHGKQGRAKLDVRMGQLFEPACQNKQEMGAIRKGAHATAPELNVSLKVWW